MDKHEQEPEVFANEYPGPALALVFGVCVGLFFAAFVWIAFTAVEMLP